LREGNAWNGSKGDERGRGEVGTVYYDYGEAHTGPKRGRG